MYEEYYGFVQPPFSLSPDPRFLYRSESHDLALQQVWQAIRRNEGFIVLTGDIGTGKTTLCRTLVEQFDPATFTALILNPFLNADELLREVLLSFGVISRSAMKSGKLATATRNDLVRALHEFLLSLVPLKGSAVLIIDEAQHLSAASLEEVRILSNLETSDKKLLQIVIVGQLNLLDMLRQANLRQLDQRISIRCSLRALSRKETEAYVTHRLFVAGGSRAVTFSPLALDLIHELSAGIPRVINLLCDRALMAGERDATTAIGVAQVLRAAKDIDLDVAPEAEVAHVRPHPAPPAVASSSVVLPPVQDVAIAARPAVSVVAVEFEAASAAPPVVSGAMAPVAAAVAVEARETDQPEAVARFSESFSTALPTLDERWAPSAYVSPFESAATTTPSTVGSSRRPLWMAGAALLLAGVAAALWLVGNPFELFRTSQPPAVSRPFTTTRATEARGALPTEVAASSAPPLANGRFSVLVGTYDTPEGVDTTTALLRARNVPVYYVDLAMLFGNLQRRVLVGRYATRVEADAVRQTLAPTMPGARVIYGELERMRVP